MMFGAMGAPFTAMAQRKAAKAEAQIREAMEDHRALNELQSIYRDWVKPPRFRKIGGQWFAEVEYPTSVPRVTKRNR